MIEHRSLPRRDTDDEKVRRQRALVDLLAHLDREREKPWYREALRFAQSFNRRSLIDREGGDDAA